MAFTISEVTIIGQIPPSQSRAGRSFNTADAAAIAAIDEILPVSVNNNIEYSGAIVRNSAGKFLFTYAETLEEPDASNSDPRIPVGTKQIGLYHTHGGGGEGKNNSESFSPQDIIIANGKKIFSYLGTPSGRIKKIVPPALLTGKDKENFGWFGKQSVLR